MSEVSFSGSEVAVISALLLSVTGALGLLFRLLIEAKNERIAGLREMWAKSESQADEALATLKEQVRTLDSSILNLVQQGQRTEKTVEELKLEVQRLSQGGPRA